jgi:2-C-methyl-D-erythritol 4-phosphate cytidylyltransferase
MGNQPATGADGVWAIVVAGGSGSRFGRPKQFERLGDRTVLDHSVGVAASVAAGVVAVVPADGPSAVAGADRVVTGSTTRAGSVRSGLAAVPDDATVILVHDAARPLASRRLFERVLAEVRGGAVAVTPVVAVVDSLRWARPDEGGAVDRERLVAVQTPQGFDAATLRAAHAGGDDASDDVTLVEVAGGRVVAVAGERWNVKITEPDDLVVASALLGAPRTEQAEDRR